MRSSTASRGAARLHRGPRSRQGLAAALGVALLLSAGCSPHDVRERPQPPLAMPASYGGEVAQAAQAKAPLPERWWTAFRDPALDRLIEATLAGNFDLQGAWARLAQANALADQAGAPRWPTLGLDASAGVTRRQIQFRDPASGNIRSRPVTAYGASGSLAASYEIDLWQKLASTARAAALEREAAADAVETLAMSLTAEVAEAFLDLVQVRARRALLERQLETNETFVELLKLRFGQGLSSSVEVNQQRQQALETRGQLGLTKSEEAVVAHRLAVLLGKPPGQIDTGASAALPEVPPLPATGVPSLLLKRRPDIRAARRRVEAADHRLAAAIADRYPTLSLTGSVSTQPGELNDWDLNPIWNLVAGLAAPILDGGRRAAEVERRRALMAELVASYGGTVLTALLEVENALAQEHQQQQYVAEVEQQLGVAMTTFEEARRRFSNGLSDFLTVLTALRSQHQVELNLLAAQRRLLSHRIQLCRALGGNWTKELKPPGEDQSAGIRERSEPRREAPRERSPS